MKKLFLDTGGILAAVNKRDSLHIKAVKVNRQLELGHVQFIITDYILVEVCNSLAKRKKLAMKTIEYLQTSEDIKILKITDSIFSKAIDIYKQYFDKDWGLTDITSFVVMQHEGINEAFTGDHHFSQFGFQVLLK